MPKGQILYIINSDDEFIIHNFDNNKINNDDVISDVSDDSYDNSEICNFIVEDDFYDCKFRGCSNDKDEFDYCKEHRCSVKKCYMNRFGNKKYCMYHFNIKTLPKSWKKKLKKH